MNATSTANMAFTQYKAGSQSAKISNVKIIRVLGADNYQFILTP